MKITSMTKEQAARMPEWTKKWIEIGLSTAPADFERATAAALKGYELANLGRPMVVLRMSSPYGATMGGILAWCYLREIFAGKVWAQVRAQVRAQVWAQVWAQVGDQVGAQVGAQVRDQVWAQVGAQKLADGVNNDRGGAFWANWIALVTFMRDVLGWQDPVLEKFAVDEELTRSCGWVWWHENVCAISDRPEVLNRDAQGRLHSETGPSIRYRDGWALHHWHGVPIPEYVIERPSEITVSRIDSEQNAEVRRVMLTRYGAARYLVDGQAELLHSDECGKLYRKELAGDEPLVMVRVLNPTPEHDGQLSEADARTIYGDAIVDTNLGAIMRVGFALKGSRPKFKEYFLRVPPQIKTAREAVAWTFGMKPKQYRPVFQS